MKPSSSALALAGTLAFVGSAHFVRPRLFDSIVPRRIPGSPRMWTYASGVAELACSAAVANPSTRERGALGAAILFVAVFPANIKMAIDYRQRPRGQRYATYARLPLQLPLIRWALSVRKNTAR